MKNLFFSTPDAYEASVSVLSGEGDTVHLVHSRGQTYIDFASPEAAAEFASDFAKARAGSRLNGTTIEVRFAKDSPEVCAYAIGGGVCSVDPVPARRLTLAEKLLRR